jgi:hypothetical protein
MHPVGLACLGATFGYAPLVSQRGWANGYEAGGFGGVGFTLKTNDNIHSIFDFPGKVIGVGGIWSSAFQLTSKVL